MWFFWGQTDNPVEYGMKLGYYFIKIKQIQVVFLILLGGGKLREASAYPAYPAVAELLTPEEDMFPVQSQETTGQH